MINSVSSAFSLQGKTILITGASSGLGRQSAITCAQRGAHLIISGRNTVRLQETYDQLPGEGHMLFTADLTQAADRDRLSQTAIHIDGLLHCAGKQKLCPIRQLSEQIMTEVYTANFLAPVMLTQRLLQSSSIAPGGSIVFLLSTAAHIGTVGVGPYSSMKAGLIGIIKCLALEVAKRKIRVNGISPSAVATPIWDASHLEDQKSRHPLGLGIPEDVANAAVFFLSDASRWITGTSLVMDGGAV